MRDCMCYWAFSNNVIMSYLSISTHVGNDFINVKLCDIHVLYVGSKYAHVFVEVNEYVKAKVIAYQAELLNTKINYAIHLT